MGTNTAQCKYKYQSKEKFNGKPYCTCLNELCEGIAFACDENCQIYEDYKQLQNKKQLCIKQSKELIRLRKELNESRQMNSKLLHKCCAIKQVLHDIKSVAGQLYYHAINDPVKREKALYSIIDIIDNAKE